MLLFHLFRLDLSLQVSPGGVGQVLPPGLGATTEVSGPISGCFSSCKMVAFKRLAKRGFCHCETVLVSFWLHLKDQLEGGLCKLAGAIGWE